MKYQLKKFFQFDIVFIQKKQYPILIIFYIFCSIYEEDYIINLNIYQFDLFLFGLIFFFFDLKNFAFVFH